MNPRNYVVISILIYAVQVVVVRLIAGTWNLPFFWAAMLVQVVLGFWATAKLDPELLDERFKPKGKDEDPYGSAILTVFFVLQLAIAALDVGRLHIADTVPIALQIIAMVPFTLGWAGFLWSMIVNKFFSSAIRLQPDRGQEVISSGPYKWVRHPGYAFASLAFFFEGFVLGSWLSVLASLPIIIYLAYRTMLEERLLSGDLAGYKDYSESVRYRWLPGVW